jgi:hypothetical protein
VQQARDRHLLLVSAGQRADGLPRRAAAHAQPGEEAELRKREVVGDAEVERQALGLAVLADHPHALPPATVRRGRGAAGV